jgi:uncharacterized 2Fe-2S/4Fe-4S cluster protein (DUF4445 family)
LETFTITFQTVEGQPPRSVQVPAGALLTDAARQAGIEIAEPCGGQGRCGRCAVQVLSGRVAHGSTLRLSVQDLAQGYTLGCQARAESDLRVRVLPQEKVERRLASDRTAAEILPPPGFTGPIQRATLTLTPPTLDNQVDDWSRLQTGLRQQVGVTDLRASLAVLRQAGAVLRQGGWKVTAIYETDVNGPLPESSGAARLLALLPGHTPANQPLWGAAVDIGTTTVTVWLVDLVSGEVKAQASEYNGQIACGEDVISRIIYASRDAASQTRLQSLVLQTINGLLEQVCAQAGIQPTDILRATVAGNSTMTHLFLGIPAASIRLSPFITAANRFPLLPASQVGLAGQEPALRLHPEACVDCLPGVASYVGSDISAGVLACGLDQAEAVSLFIDVGTNGETVLGSRDWLVTCACSAGPAFEGAGVQHGMRATQGAIEEVWINERTFEPSYRTIGGLRPRGLCGSGLISLLAELFLTGVVDKAGHFNAGLNTPRLRQGEHGAEYVVAWGAETDQGSDIVMTNVDIDNLLRAKAAIYAGFDVLAQQVGLTLETVEALLVGGSFGRYINVEKAVQIGLLPDMPWERIRFLGNTAVRGAYFALIDRRARARLDEIAAKMTYIELSADNSFYNAFMSALFLPHTDLARFPTVAAGLKDTKDIGSQINADEHG